MIGVWAGLRQNQHHWENRWRFKVHVPLGAIFPLGQPAFQLPMTGLFGHRKRYLTVDACPMALVTKNVAEARGRKVRKLRFRWIQHKKGERPNLNSLPHILFDGLAPSPVRSGECE